MPKIEFGSFVNSTNNSFTLKYPDELGEHNAVPQGFFHVYDPEPELFPEATFDPLLCLTDVTKVLISLHKMTLSICPETSRTSCRGERRRCGRARNFVAG